MPAMGELALSEDEQRRQNALFAAVAAALEELQVLHGPLDRGRGGERGSNTRMARRMAVVQHAACGARRGMHAGCCQ